MSSLPVPVPRWQAAVGRACHPGIRGPTSARSQQSGPMKTPTRPPSSRWHLSRARDALLGTRSRHPSRSSSRENRAGAGERNQRPAAWHADKISEGNRYWRRAAFCALGGIPRRQTRNLCCLASLADPSMPGANPWSEFLTMVTRPRRRCGVRFNSAPARAEARPPAASGKRSIAPNGSLSVRGGNARLPGRVPHPPARPTCKPGPAFIHTARSRERWTRMGVRFGLFGFLRARRGS